MVDLNRLPPIPITRLDCVWWPQGEARPPIHPGDALRRSLDTSARRLSEEVAGGEDLLCWWDPRTRDPGRPRPWALETCQVEGGGVALCLWFYGQIPSTDFVQSLLWSAAARGLPGSGGAAWGLGELRVQGQGAAMPALGGPLHWPAPGPLPGWLRPLPSGTDLLLSLHSPLQLKEERRALEGPSSLFFAALERLRTVCRLCGLRDPERWEGPDSRATLRRRLRRVPHPAALPQSRASLEGWVGELELHGALGDLPLLLRAMEVLRLGRGLTSGLGVVELREGGRG